MKDSVTYQALLREGREEGREEGLAEGERRLLLSVGEQRFGPAGVAVRMALDTLSVARLEELSRHLLKAESWDELLAA